MTGNQPIKRRNFITFSPHRKAQSKTQTSKTQTQSWRYKTMAIINHQQQTTISKKKQQSTTRNTEMRRISPRVSESGSTCAAERCVQCPSQQFAFGHLHQKSSLLAGSAVTSSVSGGTFKACYGRLTSSAI